MARWFYHQSITQTLTALYIIENFIQDDFHICLPYFNCLHYLFSPPVSFSQSQHFRISKETKAAKTLATVPLVSMIIISFPVITTIIFIDIIIISFNCHHRPLT